MLHRADASMIWNSFLFDKNYKWLSYNLWFIYIQFYKVLFFFDFSIKANNSLLTYYTKSKFLTFKKKKIFKLSSVTPRFSYYIDLYCFEFFNQLFLLNLYFFTNLQFYKKKPTISSDFHDDFVTLTDINSTEYKQFNHNYLQKNSTFLYNTFF
jgi:hypothetical protein